MYPAALVATVGISLVTLSFFYSMFGFLMAPFLFLLAVLWRYTKGFVRIIVIHVAALLCVGALTYATLWYFDHLLVATRLYDLTVWYRTDETATVWDFGRRLTDIAYSS